MAKKFSELRGKMAPENQEKAKEKAEAILLDIPDHQQIANETMGRIYDELLTRADAPTTNTGKHKFYEVECLVGHFEDGVKVPQCQYCLRCLQWVGYKDFDSDCPKATSRRR